MKHPLTLALATALSTFALGACQAPVNIIFADTREVGGIVYGHMIVQLPQDERQRDKITAWLHANNITFKEEV